MQFILKFLTAYNFEQDLANHRTVVMAIEDTQRLLKFWQEQVDLTVSWKFQVECRQNIDALEYLLVRQDKKRMKLQQRLLLVRERI